jgi:hypothetical protein
MIPRVRVLLLKSKSGNSSSIIFIDKSRQFMK